MQTLFGSAALGWADWARIGAVSLVIYALVEVEKFMLRKFVYTRAQNKM